MTYTRGELRRMIRHLRAASHVVKMKMVLKSLEAIKNACKRLSLECSHCNTTLPKEAERCPTCNTKRVEWEFREGQTEYHWWGTDHGGRSVGDYPLPEGMTDKDLGKCTHAVHLTGVEYEIGIVSTKDGFTLMYDFWQGGGLLGHIGGQNADRFMSAYTLEMDKIKLKSKGYIVTEEKLKDRVRLRAKRY